MVKEVHFFTEMAYSAYGQDEAQKRGYTNLMLPNADFDARRAHELYDSYFDEFQHASEVGFDGMMINEHHNNPLCMGASVNVTGSILARTTKKGKIIFLGNLLPVHDNPLRLAEEIAMIDTISGGRVVSGFVRGGGQESLATNANPAYNRERFDEAHNLIVKAWTTPGPFRWEGKHYHYRVVNPWMMPLQKPHPPIWIPGVASPESVIWAARHRYPYVALGSLLEVTKETWHLYEETAREEGYEATNENFGYSVRVACADSDERAYEEGKKFYWQLGTSFGITPRHWMAPPGYVSQATLQGRREQTREAIRFTSYEESQATYQVITGNPETVTKKLKHVIDVLDPANLILWAREGPMSHEVAMRGLELLGKEVIPALKEYEPQPDN